MSFQDKFDFCLIKSPYENQNKIIVFLTAKGLDYIDESIVIDESYRKLKSFLEDIGMVEIEFCSFESIDFVDQEDIFLSLENKGVRYSKSFEIKIVKEMEFLKSSSKASYNNPISNPSSILPLDLTSIKIPQLGGKISLFFYLFIECYFINEEDCALTLNGEFNTNENNHFRNFLGITKSEFIRTHSDIPNVLTFQSTKKFKDFLSEVSVLHNGDFKLIKEFYADNGQKGYKTKEYKYSFMEVIKNINPNSNITVHVSLDGYYNQMIERSKEIKRELLKTKKKNIKIDFIKNEANQIKSKLESKMIDYSNTDQFERAAYFKKNINILDSKIKIVNNLSESEISVAEYIKIFSLN